MCLNNKINNILIESLFFRKKGILMRFYDFLVRSLISNFVDFIKGLFGKKEKDEVQKPEFTESYEPNYDSEEPITESVNNNEKVSGEWTESKVEIELQLEDSFFEDIFNTVFPKCKDKSIISIINKKCAEYDFYSSDLEITKERIACFLAQCGHESVNFTRFKENLNYSVTGLLNTFKKYFTEKEAELYARKPSQIASRVYANRMGNGSEESRDGWKYRGRGLIQLTGKNNYKAFSIFCNKTLEDTVKYCETPEGIVESALFFWMKNELNKYADNKDFIGLTKKINGGTNGLKDREFLYKEIKSIIEEKFNI